MSNLSTDLILYSPPVTSMDFISPEVEKIVTSQKLMANSNLVIKQIASNVFLESMQPKGIVVELPEQIEELDEALFSLHRQIERQYLALPWPSLIQKVVVLTDIVGGRGDIVGSTKIIALMQRICPTLNFDWVLKGAQYDQYDPVSFLSCQNLSKIRQREWLSDPLEVAPADIFLQVPSNLLRELSILNAIFREKFLDPLLVL